MDILTLSTAFLVYAFIAFSLQTIARKVETINTWMAWIPILNLVLMLSIVAKPTWWLVLLFIPGVNIIIIALVWMDIAELVNVPRWVGFLMIFPGINLFALAYLAFT